jgi:hypothetical protein
MMDVFPLKVGSRFLLKMQLALGLTSDTLLQVSCLLIQ